MPERFAQPSDRLVSNPSTVSRIFASGKITAIASRILPNLSIGKIQQTLSVDLFLKREKASQLVITGLSIGVFAN